MEELEKAATLLTKTREKVPDNVDLLFYLGMIYSQMEENDKAIETIEEAIRLDGEK